MIGLLPNKIDDLLCHCDGLEDHNHIFGLSNRGAIDFVIVEDRAIEFDLILELGDSILDKRVAIGDEDRTRFDLGEEALRGDGEVSEQMYLPVDIAALGNRAAWGLLCARGSCSLYLEYLGVMGRQLIRSLYNHLIHNIYHIPK